MDTYSIYGPPGCGKTTEILNRISDIKSRYDQKYICFLSFTKAAAGEAAKRLSITRSNNFCTIHSLMYRLNGISSQSVVDITKLRKFGDRIGVRFKGQTNDTSEQMELGDQYISILGRSENKMNSLITEYYDSDRPGDWESFKFFCESYLDWKRVNGYVDFNDMLSMYIKNPVHHGFKIIFIDEAQDLSNLQWAVIDKIISMGVDEVHVAGDDDQAIYEWSGANTHGMREFEGKYNSSRYILDQSWRVPVAVHNVATSITARIKSRVEKTYLPRKEAGVVNRMSNLNYKKLGASGDTLILCRNFVSKKEIEDELIRHRIPYKNEGGMPSLYSSRVADTIRIFNKLKNGQKVSDSELDKLFNGVDSRTKKEIQAGDYKSMLSRGFARSVVIPSHLVDFYRDVDLTTVPNVRVSTIHASKGREADHVVLHTGLTGKTLKDMDNNPDAEARVFYVAVTRTKNFLDILEGGNGYDI